MPISGGQQAGGGTGPSMVAGRRIFPPAPDACRGFLTGSHCRHDNPQLQPFRRLILFMLLMMRAGTAMSPVIDASGDDVLCTRMRRCSSASWLSRWRSSDVANYALSLGALFQPAGLCSATSQVQIMGRVAKTSVKEVNRR